MRRNLLHRTACWGILAVVGSVSVACSGADDTVVTTVPTSLVTTTSAAPVTTQGPEPAMFGDMASPCGPAESGAPPTVAEGQNGSSPLKLGVAGDHGFAGAESAAIEMLDAARAFAAWCNDQGGLRGLPLEIVDLDAAVSGVPLAMERACADVFAMVGGGWTVDEQMFPRFHECGMVSFPAFTVSAAASMANGTVQAIPRPIDREATTWLRWVEETYSDAIGDVAIVHADLPATSTVADRLAATMQLVGGFGEPTRLAYDAASPDWTAVVEQLRNANTRAIAFIGDTSHLVSLYDAMRSAGFAADVVFGDAHLVSDVIASASTTGSFDNLRVRSMHVPFDEAGSSGVATYLEMMRTHAPAGRIGSLGVYTASALALFATAADTCLDIDSNVLERECVLAQAKKVTAWTAGGAHAATNPSTNTPTSCMLVLGVESGSWARVFPTRASSDDSGDGWACDDERIETIAGEFGDVSAGIDSSRLN